MEGCPKCSYEKKESELPKESIKSRSDFCKTPPTPQMYTLPGGSVGKESARNAGDLGSIPESGRAPGEGNGNPL